MERLLEIDAKHNDLLERLEALDRRVEQVLGEWVQENKGKTTTGEGSARVDESHAALEHLHMGDSETEQVKSHEEEAALCENDSAVTAEADTSSSPPDSANESLKS
jgi:hypothetical protein